MSKLKKSWDSFKSSKYYHNMVMFLVFVAVSAAFWLMMTFNDNAQDDFQVAVKVEDVPDSVVFINDLPKIIHVNVRDKGSALLRSTIMRKPCIHLKFDQYAHNGIFKVSNADLTSAMRSIFGSQATISFAADSIYSLYTRGPGKTVRLIIDADVTPSFQSIINAKPYAISGNTVTVYAMPDVLDTITAVYTQKIVRHDLKESVEVDVPLKPIKGARIIPGNVKVAIAVEPLVQKRAIVDIKPVNVPAKHSLMLFPSRVEVTYFAPMSQYDKASEDIVVLADYNSILANPDATHISLILSSYPDKYINTKLVQDSVEYTIVKRM